MSIADTYQLIRRLAPALARCTQHAAAQAHNEARRGRRRKEEAGITQRSFTAPREALDRFDCGE